MAGPDDERPKRSWREIDSLRDRSGGGKRPAADSPFGGGRKGEARQKTYRAKLDRLFESGGIGKLAGEGGEGGSGPAGEEGRMRLLQGVQSAVGARDITKAIDAYLGAHAWPAAGSEGEIDFLSAALEHRRSEIVARALAGLETALAAGKPRRAATLTGRLRTLEELGDDPEIRARAAALRLRL